MSYSHDLAGAHFTNLSVLKTLWKQGSKGGLNAWEQAKALAFREASKEAFDGQVRLGWACGKLTKKGGGCPKKGSLVVLGTLRPSLIRLGTNTS